MLVYILSAYWLFDCSCTDDRSKFRYHFQPFSTISMISSRKRRLLVRSSLFVEFLWKFWKLSQPAGLPACLAACLHAGPTYSPVCSFVFRTRFDLKTAPTWLKTVKLICFFKIEAAAVLATIRRNGKANWPSFIFLQQVQAAINTILLIEIARIVFNVSIFHAVDIFLNQQFFCRLYEQGWGLFDVLLKLFYGRFNLCRAVLTFCLIAWRHTWIRNMPNSSFL